MMKRGSWLACALTLGNLACGFAAVILAIQGCRRPALFHPVPHELVQGAWLLFLGMLLDGLDGRVARMTRGDGAFGAELDSLADMVSFGVAPAVLAWTVGSLAGLPEGVLWASGALYVSAAALRLARYNVAHASPHLHPTRRSPDFEGLPSPAAAGLVGGFILLLESQSISLAGVLPALVTVAGLLMVSRIPYLHVMNRLGKVPRPVLTAAGLGFLACLALYPSLTLCVAFVGYALAGPAKGLFILLRPRSPEEEEDRWTDEPLRRR